MRAVGAVLLLFLGCSSGQVATEPADATAEVSVLDATCAALIDARCGTATKDCCAAKGITYDEAGCRREVGRWCTLRADALSAGLVTFKPEFLDGCVNAWKTGLTRCDLDRKAWFDLEYSCVQLFRGVREGDEACKTTGIESISCRFGSCDPTTLRCFYDYRCVGREIPYCPLGQRCESSEVTHCNSGIPLGGACTHTLECGTYRVCKGGVCTDGLPGGATCADSNECASGACVTGACTSILADIATNATCRGE